ncbi:redoxin domain-containing protein [Micromonospora echinofusca]|uniref:Redoxin domain-containing protein n=1 Tax=Micromonospora echinofusca TaxID=47858 RepID=A0ABS3W0V2_MICEH|nr:redoxin domain-containing protein [Micromonospora echinofusca]MBO4210417.1 redoxin domain-containing protein [Micromonospora echinofusca]
MPLARRLVPGVLAVTLLLTGCGETADRASGRNADGERAGGAVTGGGERAGGEVTGRPDTGSGAATAVPTPVDGGTPPAVPATLRFTGRTVDGKPFDAATLAGRPAVLWFWAAWCTRCRAAASHVAEVQRANADRVSLVGVSGLNSGDAAMRRFVADNGLGGFPSLADDAGAVWRRFEVTSQEWYVLLDSTGTVVHSGPLTAAELRRRVAALS